MRRGRDLSRLALVLVVGLAACFLNPHHVHAFTLPPEFGLSPANEQIQQDTQFRPLFLSPLRKGYYESNMGLSVAGLSYLPLLLLGLTSFVFLFGRVPWQRLLIWLAFALLSLYSARTIPLFAVVAGPITALNWLDYAVHRLGRVPRLTAGWRQWSLGGRALSIVFVVALLVATVPGWLQSQPHMAHRVGWRVPVDPSLQEAALQIKTWHDEGQLPADAHWFNMHHDVANYLVWFAPGERAFIDQRMTQFRKASSDYLAIHASLEHLAGDEDGSQEGSTAGVLASGKQDWRSILHEDGVQFWIFDLANSQKADEAARKLLFTNPNEWKPCYLQGRIAIFAWRDARPPSHGLELDLKRLAFGPQAKQAPPRGPEIPTPTSGWWDEWWLPNRPESVDKDTAALQEVRYLYLQQRYLHDNSRVWQGAVATGAIGLSLPFGPIPNSLLALSWSCTYEDLFPPKSLKPARSALPREYAALTVQSKYVSMQDAGPPESLYLGIRAARRALLADPQDARAYLLLGHAYARLGEQTQERFLKRQIPSLAEIRRTQMTAAFQNSLRFKSLPINAAAANKALSDIFGQLGYLDVAAHHLREASNNLKEARLLPGETPAQRSQTLDQLSKDLTRLDEMVKRKLDDYEIHAANKPALDKVRIALEKGLAETALNAVEQAPNSLGGAKDLAIVARTMGLLLDLGRLDQARDLLVPEPEKAGQPVRPDYLQLHLRLTAARGDYEEADRHLADALNHAWRPPSGPAMSDGLRSEIGAAVAQVLMAEARYAVGAPRIAWLPNNREDMFRRPLLGQPPSPFWVRRWRTIAIETGVAVEADRADTYLMRGWLALEAGRCTEARQYFQTVLDVVVPAKRWRPEMRELKAVIHLGEPEALEQLTTRAKFARHWAQHYLKWLDAYPR